MGNTAIDPAVSKPLALAGRLVTMDAGRTVLDRGIIYMRDGSITAVLSEGEQPPAGFDDVPVVRTRSTICPGLIELHNHLAYDVLPLWQVPKRYTNRDQWSAPSSKDYKRLVTGPMAVLGRDTGVVPAIVRYVEVRCLLGGTTTSQGIALAVNPGIIKMFRGLVRNVEATGDPELHPVATHIADVDATDAERFLERLSGSQKLLLHLSEGTDAAARDHFRALKLADGRWAITENLIGIHCAALTAADFEVLKEHGGSMVWSPLSNLLLYGATAAIGDALAADVPIALGSDWSPSGSKSLLGELKIARLFAALSHVSLASADLLAMATSTPATMLGWGSKLGSLEEGKRADLMAVAGTTGNPYDAIIDATEADVDLVVINGVPRAGTSALMHALGFDGEIIRINRRTRVLNLAQETADPDVALLTVKEAMTRLHAALQQLSDGPAATTAALPARPPAHGAMLAASGVVHNGLTPRPHLPFRGRLTGPNLPDGASAPSGRAASATPPHFELDPLTAVQNRAFWDALASEVNLSQDVRDGLAMLAPGR